MEQKGLELTNLHSNYIKLQENIHSLEVVNLKLRKKYKSEEENKITQQENQKEVEKQFQFLLEDSKRFHSPSFLLYFLEIFLLIIFLIIIIIAIITA